MPKDTFATAITCIDGRVQRPVTDWVKLHVNVEYVDMITEPGPDKAFSTGPRAVIEDIMRKVSVSVRYHFSKVVVVAGHDTCAANPATKEEHVEQIKDAVEQILEYRLNVRVLGLWVSEWGLIELIYDSQPAEPTRSSL